MKARTRRRAATNRIELEGRVRGRPEFRLTPARTPTIRFSVECGGENDPLLLAVIGLGEMAESLRDRIANGSRVRVEGRLRAIRSSGVEIIASSIVAIESIDN